MFNAGTGSIGFFSREEMSPDELLGVICGVAVDLTGGFVSAGDSDNKEVGGALAGKEPGISRGDKIGGTAGAALLEGGQVSDEGRLRGAGVGTGRGAEAAG